MSNHEMLSVIISLSALAVSLLNYRRISYLDSKAEYKSKSILFHDTYTEVKALAEKIETEVNLLNGSRLNLSYTKSSYIGSAGHTQGDASLLKNIREVNSIKSELQIICEELNGIEKQDDRAAFDRCMEIKRSLKDTSSRITMILSQAKITINSMCNFAEAQKNNV